MTVRTQREKLVIAGGAFGVALVAALSWLMIVSPELSSASNLRQQTDDAQTMNLMLLHQVSDLRAASAQLPAVRSQMNAEREALPTSAGIDTLTRQLAATAHATHVALASVVADSPAPVTLTAPSASAAGPQNPAGKLYAIKVTVITNGRTREPAGVPEQAAGRPARGAGDVERARLGVGFRRSDAGRGHDHDARTAGVRGAAVAAGRGRAEQAAGQLGPSCTPQPVAFAVAPRRVASCCSKP